MQPQLASELNGLAPRARPDVSPLFLSESLSRAMIKIK
jgi:hypothetical protein